MRISIALLLVAAGTIVAAPQPQRRQVGHTASTYSIVSDSVAQYTAADGTLDIPALFADSAVDTPIQAPPQAAATSVAVPTASLASEIAQASRRAVTTDEGILRRATSPTWQGYPTCGPQLTGQSIYNPVVSPDDSVSSFQSSSYLKQIAVTSDNPSGWTKVYQGLNGVAQATAASIFLGSKTLTSYDPQSCADMCTKTKGCQSFNIYFERDPSIKMDGVDLTKCNNPPSVTTVGCQVYGAPITAKMATSTGQVRGNYFRTAKAGSNGYILALLTPPSIDGYTGTTFPNGVVDNKIGHPALISVFNANSDAAASGFMPSLCASACTKKAACAGFDSAPQYADGQFQGTLCLLYSKVFTSADANDPGQWRNGVWWSHSPSYFYTKQAPGCKQTTFTTTNLQYVKYYSGSGFTVNSNNPGNRNQPLVTFASVPASSYTDDCAALQDCMNKASNLPGAYYQVDLHLLQSSNAWECVAYWDPNSDPSYFNVPNSDVERGYGFSKMF